MTAFLLVALGGGAGALLRYAVQRAFIARTGQPRAGTLLVNLVGTFALGLLLGLPLTAENRAAQLLVGTGFLGGLTTFSTVMAQLAELLRAKRWERPPDTASALSSAPCCWRPPVMPPEDASSSDGAYACQYITRTGRRSWRERMDVRILPTPG